MSKISLTPKFVEEELGKYLSTHDDEGLNMDHGRSHSLPPSHNQGYNETDMSNNSGYSDP